MLHKGIGCYKRVLNAMQGYQITFVGKSFQSHRDAGKSGIANNTKGNCQQEWSAINLKHLNKWVEILLQDGGYSEAHLLQITRFEVSGVMVSLGSFRLKYLTNITKSS